MGLPWLNMLLLVVAVGTPCFLNWDALVLDWDALILDWDALILDWDALILDWDALILDLDSQFFTQSQDSLLANCNKITVLSTL